MGAIGIIDTITGSYGILKSNVRAAWAYAAFITFNIAIGAIFSVALSSIFASNLSTLAGASPASILVSLFSLPGLQLLVYAGVAIGLVSFFLSPLVSGIYLSGANSLSNGGIINMRAALATAKKRYWSLFGASILSQLILLAAVAAPLVMMLSALLKLLYNPISAAPSGLGAFFGGFLLFIAAAITLSPFLFLPQALVITEGRRAASAIKRSFSIGLEAFWRILGVLILIGLITLGIDIIAAIIYGVASIINPIAGTVLQYVLYIILSTFVGLLTLFAQVLAYKAYAAKGTPKSTSTNK
ncbi:MAG: hypothetical protein KGH60_01580 [Candidatus Micrarchaeota archaeon]|nr:hypothetical protein [Candidatus Micrarchaeota archaeon]